MISVLYVDDEADLLEIGKYFLEVTGEFILTGEISAKIAFNLLNSRNFDAIISDYQMPEMDGIEFLQSVRKVNPDIPFILFTGRGREEVVIQAINNGADFYLQKGGEPEAQFAELGHKIRQAVARRRVQDELVAAYEQISASEEELRNQLDEIAKAQKERLKSEEDFRILVENAPDAIYIQTNNRFVYLNKAALQLFGAASADQLLGNNTFTYIHPSFQDRARERVKSLIIDKQPVELLEEIYLKRDGTPIDVEVSAVPFQYEGEPGALVIIRDITVRKQVEKALRQNEKKYRDIIENIQDVVYRTDRNGKLIMFSPHGVKLAGYDSEEEMIGLDIAFDTYKNPGDRERFLAEMMQHGFVENYPLTLKTRDGTSRNVTASSHFYYDEQGNVLGIEGILHDITEIKNAEAVIRENENKFRTIFENSPYPISINRIPDGTFIAVNTAFLQSSGYAESEVLGKSPLELGLLSLIDFGKLTSHFLMKGKIENIPLVLKGKDGIRIHVRFSTIPVTIQDRPAILTVTAEISKLKSVEEELVQKNEELSASEENLRKIFENNALGMTLALPDLRFKLVNKAFLSMLGYTEEELREISFKDITHPDDLMGDVEGIRALVAGDIPVYSTEKRYIRKDGSTLWGALKVTVIRNHDGTLRYYFAQVEDITPRRRNEELLRESETKFATIFQHNPVSLTLVSATDGIFVDVNEAFLRNTGYTREEVIGKTSGELEIFADKDEYAHMVSLIRDHHHINGLELRCRIKTGKIRDCSFSSRIITMGEKPYILSTVEDITERKKAENAVQESSERYRFLLENANDGIMVNELTPKGPGKFIEVNDQACRILGMTREELQNLNLADLDTPEMRARAPETMKEILRNNHAAFQVSYLAKDYQEKTIDISVSLFDLKGRQTMLSIARDISERKRAENVLKRANRQLNLLGSITRHDINNKITVILGYLGMMKKKFTDPELVDYVEKIKTSTMAIQSQIEFTRSYMDLGAREPQWQELSSILPRSHIPDSVNFIDELPGIFVYADLMLKKVFSNLLDNSVRHGRQLSEISVSAHQSGEGLVVVWVDNGKGIPDDAKEKIFDRGYGKNTGLGLFLVREILSLTDITIKETGVEGKGARFEIAIPNGAYRIN